MMGYHFEISLQLWIDSFTQGNRYGYSEFLRFTASEKDCCSPGDNIPAIFIHKDGFIQVVSQVGKNGHFWKNFRLPAKTWIDIVIKQYPENEKVIQYINIIISTMQAHVFLNNMYCTLISCEWVPFLFSLHFPFPFLFPFQGA